MITINLGKLSTTFNSQDQRYQWCQEYIGKGSYFDSRAFWDPEVLWCVENCMGNIYFTFREEQHAAVFTLRWL